jgi:hypothetical protein
MIITSALFGWCLKKKLLEQVTDWLLTIVRVLWIVFRRIAWDDYIMIGSVHVEFNFKTLTYSVYWKFDKIVSFKHWAITITDWAIWSETIEDLIEINCLNIFLRLSNMAPGDETPYKTCAIKSRLCNGLNNSRFYSYIHHLVGHNIWALESLAPIVVRLDNTRPRNVCPYLCPLEFFWSRTLVILIGLGVNYSIFSIHSYYLIFGNLF